MISKKMSYAADKRSKKVIFFNGLYMLLPLSGGGRIIDSPSARMGKKDCESSMTYNIAQYYHKTN